MPELIAEPVQGIDFELIGSRDEAEMGFLFLHLFQQETENDEIDLGS